MKKVLYLSNIPSPYRVDFFNELGKFYELTVVFEAKSADGQGITFDWNYEADTNFKCIFLSKGDIDEKKVNPLIFKYIKRNAYDYIIVTSYAYYTEMAALLLLKFLGIPYYMEVDGGLIREEPLFKKLYKRFLIKGAKGYFSPSLFTDKYLMHYGVKQSRIHRYPFTSLQDNNILLGRPTLEEKSALRDKLGITSAHVVLGVGQFIPRKGFDLLVRAAKTFTKDTAVYIVGGKVTQEYQDIINQEKVNNIHFFEFMSRRELAEYYMAADVFVLPTREDVWGLVINEAMAYGLPVITTDMCVAGVELVSNGENGYIISSDSVNEIVNATNMILDSEDLCMTMGQRSLEIIRQYTIEKMVDAHVKVLG